MLESALTRTPVPAIRDEVSRARAERGRKPAETDLAAPLTDYLRENGYTVRSEVHGADIAAVRGQELAVVEMKLALNLAVVAQAVKRQRLTDAVYVAVPRPPNISRWRRTTRAVQHLLRHLELGLIFVSLSPGKPPVEIVQHPLPFQRRKQPKRRRAMLTEIDRRTGDYNTAGCRGRKLVTAYRENAIRIAWCLHEGGPMSPAALRHTGTGPKTQSILYNNVYSWFQRVDTGVYQLTARGREELASYPELVKHYAALLGGAGHGGDGRRKGKKA